MDGWEKDFYHFFFPLEIYVYVASIDNVYFFLCLLTLYNRNEAFLKKAQILKCFSYNF